MCASFLFSFFFVLKHAYEQSYVHFSFYFLFHFIYLISKHTFVIYIFLLFIKNIQTCWHVCMHFVLEITQVLNKYIMYFAQNCPEKGRNKLVNKILWL